MQEQEDGLYYNAEEIALVDSGYPPALAKACLDEFDYALGLRNGSVLTFKNTHPLGRGWVRVFVFEDHPQRAERLGLDGAVFDRGVDVRISEIAWCADAPFGS